MPYPTYDKHWNRTGYSYTPQYSGQAALAKDFPIACPECGGGIVRVVCLANAGTDFPNVAKCAKGHEFGEEVVNA